MNAIEKRFFDAFKKVCNENYVAQTSYNGTCINIKVLDEIMDEEETYDTEPCYNIEISTFLAGIEQFRNTDFICLSSQERVNDGYIIDFVLRNCFPQIDLAIEIDGYEWHQKTKEQVSKDKERERYLVRNGYNVIRFTGSEVYSKADECAKEALDTFVSLYRTILHVCPESFYAYIAREKKL